MILAVVVYIVESLVLLVLLLLRQIAVDALLVVTLGPESGPAADENTMLPLLCS